MTDREKFNEWLAELTPIIYYCDIEKGVSLSVLSKRPDGKVYACCDVLREQCFELILNLTDGCVDCRYGDVFDGADEWTDKILQKALELGGRMDWYARYWQAEKDGNWPMQMPLDKKLTTDFIEAYIPSKDTAAYLRSIDHKFRDVEKATIIANHENLTKEEKIEALQRLRELSTDETFCEELEAGIQLVLENKDRYFRVSDGLYQFFPIPHDFRHGDIVHFVSNLSRKKLGVILGYTEDDYRFYRKLERRYADYSDVQIPVQTPFTAPVYRVDWSLSYEYMGEWEHMHENPIYIERARLPHDNACGWYMQYLANAGTPGERESHQLAQKVIAEELEKVWVDYPQMSLTELTIYAAKAGKLLLSGCSSNLSVKELVSLPEADEIDVCKVPDYELMHGLWALRKEKEEGVKCMIILSGDTHGMIDMEKITDYFEQDYAAETFTKDDYLIILGDAGVLWDEGAEDAEVQEILNNLPVTVLFVDGNHENFDLLNACPTEEWHGGEVHRVSENILHLMRGQIFEINGATFFTFGGANSIDQRYRTRGIDWWEEEMPSEEEYRAGVKNLERCGWRVDYILTHTCPERIGRQLAEVKCFGEEFLQQYFQKIVDKAVFGDWYFGHWHTDETVEGKFHCLYYELVELDLQQEE